MYYRYTQKWVDLFHLRPPMIAVETSHYIKGMHNLLNAHFDLRNYKKLASTLKEFEKFAESDISEKRLKRFSRYWEKVGAELLGDELMTKDRK